MMQGVARTVAGVAVRHRVVGGAARSLCCRAAGAIVPGSSDERWNGRRCATASGSPTPTGFRALGRAVGGGPSLFSGGLASGVGPGAGASAMSAIGVDTRQRRQLSTGIPEQTAVGGQAPPVVGPELGDTFGSTIVDAVGPLGPHMGELAEIGLGWNR
jgi:hypothetical protein